MKTRDEFIRRFEKVMAGGFLLGYTADFRDGPTKRAAHVLDIRDDVHKLLDQMYDFLMADMRPVLDDPKLNGRPAPESVKK
jgi:hypothetical protein